MGTNGDFWGLMGTKFHVIAPPKYIHECMFVHLRHLMFKQVNVSSVSTFISCLMVCMSLSSSSDSPRPACVSSKEEGDRGDSKLLDLVMLRIAILGLPVM